MTDSHLLEERISGEEILKGGFLNAFRDKVSLPDGSHSFREYIRHPGAVMVVPLLEDGNQLRLVLERQFRYPVGQVMLEFPAGKLDAGEDTLFCAQRELQEETGYTASQWAYAGLIHPVIAYSTEIIEIWFARGLQQGQRHLDEGEFLEVMTSTPEELLSWILEGKVTDSKTVAGILWLHNMLSGRWKPEWKNV